MSYLVLARKYRPQSFAEVAGQEHVTRTLQNAIKAGRLAHAYLFSGSRGTGKTSVARILAKAINCTTNSDGTPCNECASCKAITSGASVDVIEIDAASNRGIDSVRELREGVRYAPAGGKYKIYIIDEVHMLTTEAFNALLKTLEEPPAHVVFLFATTEPHKVLPTILSRCQRFDFRRLTLAQTQEQLARVLEAEGIGMEEEAVQAIARLSEGGMRDALSLVDLVSASIGRETKEKKITEQEVAELTGVAGRALIEKTLEAITKGEGAGVLQSIEALYSYGYDVRHFYRELLSALRDALVLKSVGEKGAEFLDIPEQSRKRLDEIFEGRDAGAVDELFLILQGGEGPVFHSANQRFVLEALLLRMSQVGSLDSLGALGERLDAIEDALRGGGLPAGRTSGGVRSMAAPAASPAARPPAGPAPRPAGRGSADLGAVLRAVASRKMRWKMFLSHCRLEEQAGEFVLVSEDGAGAQRTKDFLSAEELGEVLGALAAAVAEGRGLDAQGVSLRWGGAAESTAAPPPATASTPAAGEKTDLKKQARENPVVGRVLDQFGVEDITIHPTRRR